jgi:calcineurin-like phosphoesterase family protein
MTQTETILHISDTHFGWEGVSAAEEAQRTVCLESILHELSKLDSSWKPSIVCLTGDIGWRGTTTDYAKAKEWLDQLLGVCGLDYQQLIACPGNHDVQRQEARTIGRPATSKEADEVIKPPLGAQYLRPFSEYTNFCSRLGLPIFQFGDTESYLVGERTMRGLRFIALNSAWFAKDDEDKEKLWVGLPHLKYLESFHQLPLLEYDGKGPITVALMHHPPDWLHPEERQGSSTRPNTRDYLAKRCHILLTGHTHGEVRDADRIAQGAFHFTAGATYAGAWHFNSVRLLRIGPERIIHRSLEFDPGSAENRWRLREASSVSITIDRVETRALPAVAEDGTVERLRVALRADAIKMLEQKSRLLRPTGRLPRTVSRQVSMRVTRQRQQFNPDGHLMRPEGTDEIVPFYEATRRSRRTLLLGDLGAGKSTLAGQLVVETIDASVGTLAALIPAKMLRLQGQFRQQELLQSIGDYISKQIVPNLPAIELSTFLSQQIEVLLVLDGLDEVPPSLAARILRQANALTASWPTIQIAATARPIELAGVAYEDWLLVYTLSLDYQARVRFVTEELVADGAKEPEANEKASSLVRSLQDVPVLDSLATTPLAIRLIYPRLGKSGLDGSFTLGDLLYELLLERLGGWQRRDDKPSTFQYFEEIVPIPEAKANFLGAIAKAATSRDSVSLDQAKAELQLVPTPFANTDKYRLAEEAVNYFEWLGLIVKGDTIEFPLRPLMEVAASLELVARWRSQQGNWELPDRAQWRIVSFAAAVARRRGWLPELLEPILQFIDLIVCKSSDVPAACYIVVETLDAECATRAIENFAKLGRRPLATSEQEPRTSVRNIAKTLWLAGESGFEWWFNQYLDPRYPFCLRGSAIVRDIFEEWAILARGNLTKAQVDKLGELIRPYLATGEAQFYGVLSILVVLIPDSFTFEDRVWYQITTLDGRLNGDWVLGRFLSSAKNGQDLSLLNSMLLWRASTSLRCSALWLKLNPNLLPPPSVISAAIRSRIERKTAEDTAELVSLARDKIGADRWLRFARWSLASLEANAAGGAVILSDNGETRLSVLGDALMRAMHDGAYFGEAEQVLDKLIESEKFVGVRWLAERVALRADRLGARSGWWRLLLKNIESLDDGPELLANCLRNMGPYTLPRYPEIRASFARLLNGPRGEDFRRVLQAQLHNLDPQVRCGAAMILVTTDPQTEADALFVAVRCRAHRDFDTHEWESFCLSLDFSPSVLSSLRGRLQLLDARSRTLALILLLSGGMQLDPSHRIELESELLEVGNWHLARTPAGQELLGDEDLARRFLSKLGHTKLEMEERIADQLLNFHRERLSAVEEAKCLLIRTTPSAWDLADLMLRVYRDQDFRVSLTAAWEEIRNRGTPTPLLGLVARANVDPSAWKDVIWSLLCDDVHSHGSSDTDACGDALLEYGLQVPEHRKAIGESAMECLKDPRLTNNRWTDAYHWVAVIADEFVGLDEESIRSALRQGRPITCCAAASLLARLGDGSAGVEFEHGTHRRPSSLPKYVEPKTSVDVLANKLREYSRDSEDLHPGLIEAIEECLFASALPEHSLADIGSVGKPGALISNALRFCYGLSPRLSETLPVLDTWGRIWRQAPNRLPWQRLLQIWSIVRESVIRDDPVLANDYVVDLEGRLERGEIWKLALASEILRVRGSLTASQVRSVFFEYADHPSFLHDFLFDQLTKWLGGGELDANSKDAVVKAAREVMITLNEAPWEAEGTLANSWACLLFPPVQWVFEGKSSLAAEEVFLRGLKFAFQETPGPYNSSILRASVVQLVSGLEPLLKKAPRRILGGVISAGLAHPEPSVRAFCSLIQGFAEFSY